MQVAKGLRVRITASGWCGKKPDFHVFDGCSPVLAAYVDDGKVDGWLSSWDISGSTIVGDVDEAYIRELMGWTT